MPLFYFFVYLLMCALIGISGKKLPLGFSGFFILSFFLTPLVGIILLALLSMYSDSLKKEYSLKKENG
jgi:hypothetical protein